MRTVGTSAAAPALWGTTYLVTTELLPAHRPLLAGTLRALPAGLLLLGLVSVFARRRAPVGRSRPGASILPGGAWWWRAPLLGTLNIGVFFALLFVAAYRLPGGVAAVVGAVGPFVVAGIAFVLLGERPAGRTLVAAAIGVGGVALLVLRSSVALDPVGLLAAAGGTVVMSLGTVLGRRWGTPAGFDRKATALLALTGWQLTAGGLLLLPVALLVEGPPPALTALNLTGYGYLSIVGTAFAYVLWFRGVTSLAPARVTVLALLSPAVAALLGWAVLGQALSAGQVVGFAAVLGAVVLGTSTPGGATSPGIRPGAGRFGHHDVAPRPATSGV
ncbi:ABC transporter permease [Virgisporangium ochraceum]|uniref:ABC transporter permease n=2 Tax=Virgisporangium ochraceum TaxID=65505 RepID=A0A8J4EF78_9ACTN|nr:ABC transporter permease [Virgisporangium ochraceum]